MTIMLELFNAKHEIHVHIMYTCISNYCFATVYDPDKGQAGWEGERGMEHFRTTATSGEREQPTSDHHAGALP